MVLEKGSDAHVHSNTENADDMKSADDPGEDGEQGREGRGEQKDEAEDSEEEEDLDFENGVEDQEVSALAIIDPW